tara:strand:+ start:11579 stop:11971 length:393 start_codon:yes stop_codon:yes gene_type:complete
MVNCNQIKIILDVGIENTEKLIKESKEYICNIAQTYYAINNGNINNTSGITMFFSLDVINTPKFLRDLNKPISITINKTIYNFLHSKYSLLRCINLLPITQHIFKEYNIEIQYVIMTFSNKDNHNITVYC